VALAGAAIDEVEAASDPGSEETREHGGGKGAAFVRQSADAP
jgi:hypothetical protein